MHTSPVMRANLRRLIRAGVGVATLAVTGLFSSPAAPAPGTAISPVAVVELFTSEGCSSCPPADELLGQLAADARDRHVAVYCLAFHVDYWDRLGWKDPFSSPAYSDRQSAYARATNSEDVYTPEMIVNGIEPFVGSDRARAARAIDSALRHAAKASVDLRPLPGGRYAFSVTGAPKSAVLQVAVVEGGLVSRVAGGENSGRVLHHENVVRAFLTVPLEERSEGTIDVPLPAAGAAQPVSVIAFVQARSMAILGATELAVPR